MSKHTDDQRPERAETGEETRKEVNAVELFHQDGKSAKAWYCKKCRIVAKDKERADSCCEPRHCDTCKKEIDKKWYQSQCSSCLGFERQKQMDKRLAEAELVPHTEMVWSHLLSQNEGYFQDIDCILEEIEDVKFDDPDFEHPDFVFACKPRMLKADIEDILGRISDNGYEDICENLSGVEELESALEKFNKVNENELTVWEIDYKRKCSLAIEKTEKELD